MDIHAWINSVISGFTVLGLIATAMRFGRYAERVDTMWKAFLQGGAVAGVARGLFEMHSPMRLVNDSGNILCSMKDELRAFYESKCRGMSEEQIALAIQKQFGARLTEKIWVPNNIPLRTGILIAVAVAKGTDTLSEILDHTLPTAQPPEC